MLDSPLVLAGNAIMVSYISGRTRRTLSDADIVRLYVEGLDSDTIGARANCTATTVLDLVRKAGEIVRSSGGPRKPDRHRLTDAEICARYRRGDSGPTIADAAACSASAIYHILRRNNVPVRSRADVLRALASRPRSDEPTKP